jgi:hypothetical protein
MCDMDSLEIMTSIIAGACHDFKHPGLNNYYLMEARDPIALLYNGKALYYLKIKLKHLHNL